MDRRRLLISAQKGRLPAEYQEVEYLESTGTQYIDTGFIPTINTKIEAEFQLTSVNQQQFAVLFGTQNESVGRPAVSFYVVSVYEGRFCDDVNHEVISSKIPIDTNKRYISLAFQKMVLDGVEYTNLTNTFSSKIKYSLYIFARNYMNGAYRSSWCRANLFYLRIFENDVLVRNFIPCYRKSDNKAGMYDTVTKTFFTNAGTEEFIVGGDVD